MAYGFHPLRRGTIMMFRILEFMSLGSGYDMVLLAPRGDVEPCPEPIPPQSVRATRSGHHAGAARWGRRRSRISDPTSEARVRPALPSHIPHQIAYSSGSTRARGRPRGASSSAPRTNRGSSRPPVPPRSKGKARLPPTPQKGDKGASSSRPPPPTDGGETAAPPEIPFGLRNAAATYASSVSTSLSAYTDLRGHHLRSTLDLIVTPPVSSYPEDPTSGDDEWAGADFFRCGDPETFSASWKPATTASVTLTPTMASMTRHESASTSRSEGRPTTLRGVQDPLGTGMPLHLPTRLPGSILDPAVPPQLL